ncbi:AAC(3) family N-acetyltransferase [Kitasatospora sp. NPDC057904]|uniref:AAC(3) family N-acetyltransferase n=1 Tax=Kitasatospora sp. NPDC057904 TaxID=3346275 RepID=UPI0036D777CF
MTAWLAHLTDLVVKSFDTRGAAARALNLHESELSRRLTGTKLPDIGFVHQVHMVCVHRYRGEMPSQADSERLLLGALEEVDLRRYRVSKRVVDAEEERGRLADRAVRAEARVAQLEGELGAERESADQLAGRLRRALDERGRLADRAVRAEARVARLERELVVERESADQLARQLERSLDHIGQAAALRREISNLGVRPGQILLVHVGPVDMDRYRAQSLALALFEALGPDGTLVVSTATPENSKAFYEPLAGDQDALVRQMFMDAVPAFDPATTPSSPTLSALSEVVRTTPGALRSSHPQASFAAVGPWAARIVGDHPAGSAFGWRSPIASAYQLDARVLIIGGPLRDFPAYYLADHFVPEPARARQTCKVLDADGWVSFDEVNHAGIHTPELDKELQQALHTELGPRTGRVGPYEAYLLPLRESVEIVADRLAQASPSTT